MQKIHAEHNGNMERHEVSKIEDRVQCRRCPRNSRPGETLCGCGRVLQGITEEVRKQAEQRISSRLIMYVPGMEHLKTRKNSEEQKMTQIPRTSTVAERSWSATSMTSNIENACINKDTRRPTWNNLNRVALEKEELHGYS